LVREKNAAKVQQLAERQKHDQHHGQAQVDEEQFVPDHRCALDAAK
jgi:hypothetical protein